MKRIPLSAVAEIAMGSAPPSTSYNTEGQGTPMIAGAGDFGENHPTAKKWTTAVTRLARPGDLIVCVRATIGDLNWADRDYCLGRGVAGIRAIPGKADIRYVARFLAANKAELSKLGTGSTFLAIRRADLEQFEIPLPSFDEQRRIAAVLDRADELRRERQESQRLAEKFLRSLFLDMFGDPVQNPKGLPTEELHKLAKLERGRFSPRPRNDPSYYGGRFPFIQTGDITRSAGRITSWTQTLNDKGAAVSKEFATGTVIIAIVGATLGETAIVETPVYCPDSIIGITPHRHKATPEFVEFLLRLWKPRLKQLAPDAARANLNLERLRPLPALVPPIETQNEFSQVANKLRALALAQQESGRELSRMFSSIEHRAFLGELDLSHLVLDRVEPQPRLEINKAARTADDSGGPKLVLRADQAVERALTLLEDRLKKDERIPWSLDYFKYRVLGSHPVPFTFNELMQKAESIFEEPRYDEIRNVVFGLLGHRGEQVRLRQRFDPRSEKVEGGSSAGLVFEAVP